MSLMLLLRAKDGGRCPPSFLKEENMSNEDGFESELVEVLAGANGAYVRRRSAVSRSGDGLTRV